MEKITFKELGLSNEVQKGIEFMGYISPSPIQEKAIPGRNFMLLDKV